MKRLLLALSVLRVLCFAAAAADDFSWLRGANYVPSYARNDVQTWMDYDPALVDRELGYTEKLKLNCVRVFLQIAVYERDPKRFLDNFESFLSLCAKHRLQMMPVLFDSCFGEFPDLEKYREKDWMACPGQNRLGPEHWLAMQKFVRDVVGGHKDDQRIVMWDVMNEPTCTSFYKKPEDMEAIHMFLKQALGWVKAQQPSQPRTVGLMHSKELNLVQDDMDVLGFHNYRKDLCEDIRHVQELGRKLGKPVILNEVVMRPQQPFDFAVPILREEKIGWVFWELMFGKTQFTRDANSIQGLIYPDGTCRDAREVAAVMNVSVEEAKRLFPQPRPAPPPLADKSNSTPRMLFGDDTRHGRPFAKDPTVLRLGERYLMYYSMAPSTNKAAPKGWAVGIAESRDLVQWKKVGEILPEQPCEQNGLVNGKALLLAGKVHLFYNTYGNGKNDALCHATSNDGLKFARDPSNPILHPTGNWNSGRAIDCDAFEFGGKLWLIYATRDPSMKTQMLVAATADLKSDFGRAAWTPVGDGPILKPELPWETRCIEAPSVIQRGDTLYLFYGGGYNNDPQQIGCATSTDGHHWTRLFREPLIPNGQPGDWNASETGHPGIFTDTDGRTYLFVQGNNDKGRTWFLSAYEIAWQGTRPTVVWDSNKFPMKRPGPAAHHEDSINYSEGWTCWRGRGPRGDGLHFANAADATASWESTGGDVTLIHKVGPDCGFAQVLIDGQPAAQAEFDTYAPRVKWNHRRVLAKNLPSGRHLVTVVATGKKNEKSLNSYVQIVDIEQGSLPKSAP